MKNFFIILKDMYEDRLYNHQIQARTKKEAIEGTLDIYEDYLMIDRNTIKIISAIQGTIEDSKVIKDLQDVYSLFNLHA